MSDTIVRWEPSHVAYSKSCNPNTAPDLGWAVYYCGYNTDGRLITSRAFSIDIVGCTELMRKWCDKRK